MTAEQLWGRYIKEKDPGNLEYEAWQFGSAPDELADLVKRGIKTATCSLYHWYENGEEKLPAEGEYSVILNSKDEAQCIIRTTRVSIVPYCDVSGEHAYMEGEGDRSLTYWKMVHKQVFSEELLQIQKEFTDEMKVVCEEFELLYTAGQ